VMRGWNEVARIGDCFELIPDENPLETLGIPSEDDPCTSQALGRPLSGLRGSANTVSLRPRGPCQADSCADASALLSCSAVNPSSNRISDGHTGSPMDSRPG